jgi:hypothetical protein
MHRSIPPFPQYALIAWFSVKKHKNNFTLIYLYFVTDNMEFREHGNEPSGSIKGREFLD